MDVRWGPQEPEAGGSEDSHPFRRNYSEETLVCIKKTAMRHKRGRWVLLKIPRGDIDEWGEEQ